MREQKVFYTKDQVCLTVYGNGSSVIEAAFKTKTCQTRINDSYQREVEERIGSQVRSWHS